MSSVGAYYGRQTARAEVLGFAVPDTVTVNAFIAMPLVGVEVPFGAGTFARAGVGFPVAVHGDGTDVGVSFGGSFGVRF